MTLFNFADVSVATPLDDISGLKLSWVDSREKLDAAEADNIRLAINRYLSSKRYSFPHSSLEGRRFRRFCAVSRISDAACISEKVSLGLEKLKIEGKNVLIVDDIFDSGFTLSTLADKIAALKPKSVRSLIFLSKKIERPISYQPTYVLFEVENLFVFGYGMDYKEHLRGIPDVCCVR